MASPPDDKRALLAQLLREKTQKAKQAPLSFAQERMWFLYQWNPASAAFNMPGAVRLSGEVDPEALRRGLQELARRHETLRTTFSDQEGRLLQVVASSLEIPLSVEDLRDVPEEQREQRTRERITAEARQTFDLTRGPLLRAVLLRLAEREHVLLLSMHHIISDGWSLGVLVRELAALYAAFVQGQPSPLQALPLQYAEFASWQREWLQGEVLDTQLSWWRERLDPNAILELPTDRPRPPALSPHGARQTLLLPPELAQTLKALGQREGKTLFVTLLSAFEVLLHRYTGQEDLVVGTPIAGRNRSELEGMIGLFINTLALRTSVAGRPTFRELMGRVHQTTVDAFAHQDLPFERLVDALKPERRLSHSPLFQVMFILQNAPMPPLQAPGLVMEFQQPETGTTKFDLTLIATELPEGLRIVAEYSTDLFGTPAMSRLLEHYRMLLQGIAANPDQPIDSIPLLTGTEHRALQEWNDTPARYPRDVCLHQLIEAQVERTPDAIALTFEGQSLTYRELDSRANQLAWHLRSLGVGPESRVGLCLERSLEMVVALLATHKAGGAYVPLDPAYPQERLGWMLEDARPTVLLAQERLLSRLPAKSTHVVCVDSGWADISLQPRHAPPAQATANNLAYTIFTSGSTGRPKGAMNEHHAVVNRLLWMQDEYELGAQDVVLQKTPFSFDVSVWEFFWPLMQGARLVLAKPGGHQDPDYLARLIAQERVTTLHFVPSMLKVFLEESELEQRCASLKRVVCSGEALPVEFQEQFFQRLPHAELHNLYGPTEAAVDVTYYACKPGQSHRSIPIGRPVANTVIRILDAQLKPVPIGVSGELYIGGVQVGRGYRARPNLTAERFIPDAFSDAPGARMYRTGDVARWLEDGNIEYLGRADFQVKIRGFRIELGEIETLLAQHPAVRQVAVVVREDRPGDKRLVAYVVAASEQPQANELRSFLQSRLPEHMVPSAFVALETLPLSPNGKLDRRALPAPELGKSQAGQLFEAPRTELEQLIAGIWKDVLQVERVGVDDAFFALGGNSLLALQVHRRLKTALGTELALTQLFQYPTVRALAERLSKQDSAPDSAQTGRARAEARRAFTRRAGARARTDSQDDGDDSDV
ncbi:non-ribosomal peptide synthetase [Vitiosangium sp. GDMCC 1.1324]|uniref:non-ribosomal peptide synthetase n=1 Tax=Vitiosangium sp. (strain GDMCC 1.1324) TaxID=2138576 RepID=UPI000D3AE828|nr:non-ribosomal peptide synthetase [Vitiosangium sp. GDMCC 1.1324]PTL75144.1 non-ribosomal peptide synthetase [Vitiosangium sp. GDMCC 1.1324]